MRNPILPGFHADSSICRKGDDYYLAVSSFEWFPGIPIYHSRDLKHWELLTHGITDDREADLLKLPSAKGIWAPCLTWCEQEGLFYLTYSVMHSMNARYFDVDNFVKTAPEITGPWSETVYLHSAGFDASMFHDTDGRKYVVALDWETRETYEKPGAICLMEYDPRQKKVVGPMKRIYTGGTERGCIEGPHLTKRGDWYYLMCAEGGTGYAHAVTMARSASVWGPYEPDPQNPIVTSVPGDFNERQDWDHLKPRYFNAVSYLQKSGHGSYVDTPLGETYLVHLCARPFRPELRCTLGRETAMQKMTWTGDGWLRMADGGNLARAEFEPSRLPEVCWPEPPVQDDFDGPALARCYYAPRWAPERFATLADGALYLRGQESLCSLNKTSLLARKLTSVETTVTTRMQFCPTSFHHSAGLVLYYDNMDYAYLELYREEEGCPAMLRVRRLQNGVRTESAGVVVPEQPLYLRLTVLGRSTQFSWSADGQEYRLVGPVLDTSEFSDEYCQYGEFTGAFVGLACEDSLLHQASAKFDFFRYEAHPENDEAYFL